MKSIWNFNLDLGPQSAHHGNTTRLSCLGSPHPSSLASYPWVLATRSAMQQPIKSQDRLFNQLLQQLTSTHSALQSDKWDKANIRCNMAENEKKRWNRGRENFRQHSKHDQLSLSVSITQHNITKQYRNKWSTEHLLVRMWMCVWEKYWETERILDFKQHLRLQFLLRINWEIRNVI